MTDHRPEVRCLSEYAHHKESCDIECLMADEHPSCTCGLMEALAALSAPPIEPVGVREALEEALAIANEPDGPVNHLTVYLRERETRIVNWKRKAQAALAASEQPVVVDEVEVSQLGFCSARLRDMGFTSSDRVRVQVWKA